MRISIIGLDGTPLAPGASRLLDAAALVAGGRRHLEETAVGPERSVVLEGNLSEALSRIETENGPVAVLASGDPGFFGITRLIGERFGAENLAVLPAVSSVSLAFARAGLSWDDAVVVSAHGREPRRAVNVCRARGKVAVLTSPGFGPAELAREIRDLGRTFVVGERLGGPDERVFQGDAAGVAVGKWADPNVVLVLDEGRATEKGWLSSGQESPGRWALPEDRFEHRSGMITKRAARAVVLSRLGPGTGDMIWDVGAGSGSVAIECARLGAAAVAVEHDPESCGRIRRNAGRHGVYVQTVEGSAPEALRGLPEPDAVFVGGTGGRFEEIVATCAASARRTVVVSLVGLERVVPAGEILEDRGFEVETTFHQTSVLKGIGDAHRLAPEGAVFLVCGSRP